MSSPKHLWSGDWERESASAAADRAERLPSPPVEPVLPEPPAPSQPSALARAVAALRAMGADLRRLKRPRLRPGQRRLALMIALGALVIAGGAVALSSSGGSSPVSASGSTAWLGVQLESVPVARVLVAGVVPGSPADRAGLGAGDLIVGVDGHAVTTPGDIDSVVAGKHVGDRLALQVQRGSGSFNLEARLTAQPASYP
jgi:hypothetical protein